MVNELFVCEKPSQAKMYAAALSTTVKEKSGYLEGENGQVFTYAFGHLVSAVPPDSLTWNTKPEDLPSIHKDIQLQANKDTVKQFTIIKNLMKEAKRIVIATDAGREGEHIFRKIYALAKTNKPLMRLWVQDSTTEGIRKAYKGMKDGKEYDGLAVAGQLREEADMLVGLNATILATKLAKSSSVISYGRVQTPTLAMIVRRDEKVEKFTKEKHFTIKADAAPSHVFEMVLPKDRKLEEAEARSILNTLGNRCDYKVEEKEVSEKPERLFDLTSLQMFMNDKHGWSAKKTLDTLQKLYETHKVVTYPRTSSRYVASSEEFPMLLEAHKDNLMIQTIVDEGYSMEPTFINPKKVTDHEAVIITAKKPTGLNAEETVLYHEVFMRFVASFYPKAVRKECTATFKDGEETFKTTEKVLVVLGWRVLFDEQLKASTLDQVKLSDVGEYQLLEKETSPPKRYTEKTLLGDMEGASKFLTEDSDKKMLKECGIGTPATRAAIIELLCSRKFVEKKKGGGKKEQLISTPLGRSMIQMFPEDFILYNVQMTALLETQLAEVEEGSLSKETFYDQLETMITTMAGEIKTHSKPMEGMKAGGSPTKEEIIACPSCGKPIIENTKAYSCSGYREGCKVTIWKNGVERFGKKKITKTEAKKLLEGKEVTMKFMSKAKKEYKKPVVFNQDNKRVEVMF